MTMKKTPVWKKPRPASRKAPQKLTPAQKAKAKAFAERTGTRYPSLVANMAALREDRGD
jgi:hypothetical protein